MRLTIVCPPAYPVIVPGEIDFAGGAEYQLLNLARALRDRGHEISWVVGDYGQPDRMEVEGFLLHRAFRLSTGNGKLRFLPDMWKLRRAIHRARPQVVNQRSTSFYTGQCCRFSHEVGSAFVFSLGIDYNCYPDLLGRAPGIIQKLYGWGIRRAEAVLAQTEEQRALMETNFGRPVQVLPNMLALPPRRGPAEEQPHVLWVGSMARRKRPELFLDLARRRPDLRFTMVGGAGEDVGYDAVIRTEAASLENLEFVGFVPPPQMEAVYRSAALYVNTSRLEGLPNAFLQSWSHGVPAVSVSVDPDRVIAEKKLGRMAEAGEALAEAVGALMADPEERARVGERCRRHVEECHDVDSVAPRAEAYFLEAIERRGMEGRRA